MALWQYVPLLAPFGGYGFIRHYTSQKYLVPYGGSTDPPEGTQVVIADSLHIAHVFTYLQDKHTFTHLGGLHFNPASKNMRPAENELVRLFKQQNMAAWFDGVDANNQSINIHGAKVVGGQWVKIYQVLNPMTQTTKTLKYKEGYSQTEQASVEVAIESSISAKFMGIGASLKYNAKFGYAASQTWSAEKEDTTSFTIFPGKSVCKYQYIFHGNFDTFNLGF